MKYPLTLALAASALLLTGLAFTEAAQNQDPLQQRLQKLEQDLADCRARVAELAQEHKQGKAQFELAQKYLESQAKAAKAMADALDQSEQAGFTYGINPESRQILLRGWREQLGAAQQAVPTPPAAKPEAKPPERKP